MFEQDKIDTVSAINRHKNEEKKNSFITTKFKILQNKKAMAQLSSNDMLLLSEALEIEKGYSTKRMKDQLRSFVMLRAEKVIKGKMPADDGFVRLVSIYGSNQQKNFVCTHFAPKHQEKPEPVDTPHTAKDTAPKNKTPKKSWLKRVWKAAGKAAVVVGVAAMSLIGGKALFNNFSSDKTSKNDNKETTFTPKQTVAVTPIEEQKNRTEEQAPASEKQDAVITEFQKVFDNLNKAYKDRFDSALEIHLGAEKRDQLYQQIDKLAEDGKIEFKDGTTREWYAHAFTMYAKVSPNSDGGKLIAGLLAGEDVDKTVLNDLVIKAKRDGTGISGTGSYSAFDNAPQNLQQKHIQNRQNVISLEKLVQKSR